MSYGYCIKSFSLTNAVSEGILSPQSFLPDDSDQNIIQKQRKLLQIY